MRNILFDAGPFVARLNAIVLTVCMVRKPSDCGRHNKVSLPTFELTSSVKITLPAAYTYKE